MQKRILKLVCASLLFLQISCAGLPPDEPICSEITPERGACVLTMSGKEFEINETNKYNGKTWWEMKPAMLMMPAQTWARYKAWIIKICKGNNQCDSVSNWERTLNTVDENVQTRLP